MKKYSFKKLHFLLPPHTGLFLSELLLKIRGRFFKKHSFVWKNKKYPKKIFKNLNFNNPLGIAGGLDKSAALTQGWWTYGVGFIEVGTITPDKQEPHKGKILDRDISKKILWNYMGFPNKGVKNTIINLKKIKKPYPTPLFISIGKGRQTPLEKSHEDYNLLINKLHSYADAFVVNISSPNTSDLRNIFTEKFLKHFLQSLRTTLSSLSSPPLLLLKISPDLSNKDFLRVLSESESKGIDGWIVCNTTSHREQNNPFPHYGGISGTPLASRSKEMLKMLINFLGSKKKEKLVISCGGIMNSTDVIERLDMGADLVQVYSALVFEGPSFFKKIHLNNLKS